MVAAVLSWSFEWLTSWSEVRDAAFQNRWMRWTEDSPASHVFFHPALAMAWIDTYLPLRDMQPRFLVAHSGSADVFLPLVRWRRNWRNAFQRLWVPVGYSDYDYHDPLSSEALDATGWASFWSAFLKECASRWRDDFDEILVPGIRDGCSGTGSEWTEAGVCPLSDLSECQSIADFTRRLRKSLRGDLGRQQRRLEQLGPVTYVVARGDDVEQAVASVTSLLEHHARRWPNAYKPPGLHRRLVSDALAAGVLHMSELRLSSRAISWHLGFIWRGRYYYYLPAMDPEYAQYSPGKLHLLKCVEDAIRLRLRIFDHLRGVESYKNGWCDQVTTLKALRHAGQRPMNSARNWWADCAKPWLRRSAAA